MVKKVTFVEETSVPVALLGILFETVLVVPYASIISKARDYWNGLTATASGLCLVGCRRPVSLKVVESRKDVESGSSLTELLTALDGFPTKARSGTSSSSDYVVESASRRAPGASLTSPETPSPAALSSASRFSMKSFVSFTYAHDRLGIHH